MNMRNYGQYGTNLKLSEYNVNKKLSILLPQIVGGNSCLKKASQCFYTLKDFLYQPQHFTAPPQF